MPTRVWHVRLCTLSVWFAASQTDERLTDKGAEDSIQAGLHAKAPHNNNVVVESDGPESDRPETTASMGTHILTLKTILTWWTLTDVVCDAASMIQQSLEGWRLIGQAMQSLFTCSCFAVQNPLSQLRSAGREQ